jgi:hypothetical protein
MVKEPAIDSAAKTVIGNSIVLSKTARAHEAR